MTAARETPRPRGPPPFTLFTILFILSRFIVSGYPLGRTNSSYAA